jgi:hypothetical protein
MALFSQDDEEEIPRIAGPDFSGGSVAPDSESETPSPIDPDGQQGISEVVPVDYAADYSQPVEQPKTQEQDTSGVEIGGEDGAAQYAVQGQPVPSMNDPNGTVPQPTYDPYLTYADHSADSAAMQAQKAKEAGQNINPSRWRRLGAALAGGAVAFGSRNPAEGMKVADAINEAPANRAREQWQRDEAPIQAKMGADQAQDAATQRANQGINANNAVKERNYRTQVIGNLDAARAKNFAAQAAAKNEGINGDGWKPDDPNNPLGSYSGTSIGGKPLQSSAPPKSVQLDPEYKIAAAAAKGTPFTTEQQQILRSGGKLTFRPPPNPRQANAEEQQWGAYVRSLGHAPTTQDVINFKRGTPGDNDPETVIAKNMQAKDAFINQWRRVGKDESTSSTPEGSYVSTDGTGRIMTGPEFNARVEKFRTDLNASTPMLKSGTQVDSNGNTVSAGQPQQQAPQQQQPIVKHFQGKPYTKDAKTGQWVLQQPGR